MLQVKVTGRHFRVTDAIREHAQEKVGKLSNHFDRVTAADLVLAIENGQVVAELTVPAPRGHRLVATGQDKDLYAAVDAAVHRMERRIDRLKERMQERRPNRSTTVPAGSEPESQQPETAPE